ncbi:MAG: ABC transporter substrate-binding protein [bacterium]
MKKAIVISVAVLFVAVLLVGASSAEKVKLSVMTHTHKPFNDWMTERIELYKKVAPNVEIEYSYVPHGEYDQKIFVMLEAGTGPDIMNVYYPTMHDLVRGGYLDPAPSEYEADIKALEVPEAWRGSTVMGKVYGYVTEAIVLLPIANVDLYKKAGLDYPTSYDDLLMVQKKLTIRDAAGTPEQFGVTLSTSGLWIMLHWSAMLRGYGGEILTPDGKEAAFNTPAGIAATEDYVKLAPIDVMPDAFRIGKAATIISGAYARPWIRLLAPDMNIISLPAPKGKDGKKIATSYHWTMVVNSKSKQKAEAWKFVKWTHDPDNWYSLLKAVEYPPVDKTNIERFREDPWMRTFIDEFQYGKFLPAERNWTEAQTAITTEIERILTGEVKVADGLKKVAADVKRILAR